jgi:hypothetical protein
VKFPRQNLPLPAVKGAARKPQESNRCTPVVEGCRSLPAVYTTGPRRLFDIWRGIRELMNPYFLSLQQPLHSPDSKGLLIHIHHTPVTSSSLLHMSPSTAAPQPNPPSSAAERGELRQSRPSSSCKFHHHHTNTDDAHSRPFFPRFVGIDRSATHRGTVRK